MIGSSPVLPLPRPLFQSGSIPSRSSTFTSPPPLQQWPSSYFPRGFCVPYLNLVRKTIPAVGVWSKSKWSRAKSSHWTLRCHGRSVGSLRKGNVNVESEARPWVLASSTAKCDVHYNHSLSLTTMQQPYSYRTMSNQDHMTGDNQPTFPVAASSGSNFFTRAQNVFVTGSQFLGVHGNYVCNFGLVWQNQWSW